jgi:hypothetical protein
MTQGYSPQNLGTVRAKLVSFGVARRIQHPQRRYKYFYFNQVKVGVTVL